MDILELAAESRQGSGKGGARKLRAAGKIPAILYGHDTDALPLAVDRRALKTLLHTQAGTHIIKLKIDNQRPPTVILKEIQRDPVRDDILHLDFQRIAMNERITAAVPITVTGDSIGVREGGILQHGLWEVQVEALPTDMPDHLEGDVANLGIGDSLRAGELRLPDNVILVTPPEETVATILPPTAYKEEVPVAAAEEAAAEAAAEAEKETEAAPESKSSS